MGSFSSYELFRGQMMLFIAPDFLTLKIHYSFSFKPRYSLFIIQVPPPMKCLQTAVSSNFVAYYFFWLIFCSSQWIVCGQRFSQSATQAVKSSQTQKNDANFHQKLTYTFFFDSEWKAIQSLQVIHCVATRKIFDFCFSTSDCNFISTKVSRVVLLRNIL